MSFVNVSCDPVTGTDQKGNLFWQKVAAQVRELYLEESEVPIVGQARNFGSFLTRYQRHIQPDVLIYNKFHLEVSTKEKWMGSKCTLGK